MKYIRPYQLFESLNSDDIQDIFIDMEGLNISFTEYSNIYLDINFDCVEGINTIRYQEEFNRLLDYMNSNGYEFEYFNDIDGVFYLNWVWWKLDKLFEIPNYYLSKLKKLTIHFKNTNFKEGESIFESLSDSDDNVFSCKETIEDLLLPLTDENIDILVTVMDKSWDDTKMIKKSIESTKKEKWKTELMETKPSMISIRFAQNVDVYNIDYDDRLINETFESITNYCKSIGMNYISVVDMETRGNDDDNDLLKVGIVYYFKNEIKPSFTYCTISEHENIGDNLQRTFNLLQQEQEYQKKVR